jgi:NAD+ kinase
VPDAVGFVCHARVGVQNTELVAARKQLEEGGFRVWNYCPAPEDRLGALSGRLDGTRLLVSVGGDGTVLWSAQQAGPARIPVLGVNAGRLGFLTEVQLTDICQALERWARGDFALQKRALLEVEASPRGRFTALNDAVVHKGIAFNLIRIEVEIDGQPAGDFEADGALISTATGSTGYALSLGGPIVHPQAGCLIFLPINPHSLFTRPVVLPSTSRIVLRLPREAAVLICDGQPSVELEAKSVVEVSAGSQAVDLVRFHPQRNFFQLLHDKLRWGLPLTDGE